MVKEQIVESTIMIYEELYQQCTLRKNYVLVVRAFERKQLEEFANYLLAQYRQEEIGIELLMRFFEFQFSRYVGVETRYGKNSILLHWLVGKKALKEWKERDVKKNWLVKVRLRQDFVLQLNRAFKNEIKIRRANTTLELLNKVNSTEEKGKLAYYNTPEGLVWCGTVNTVFNPLSELCLECKNKNACIEILQTNYPALHKNRMQIWQKTQQS